MSISIQIQLPEGPKRIAFTGYGGAGKDEAAKPLIKHGYERRCFGDVIKRQVDPLFQKHLGFSAFTTDPQEKLRARPVLETWGELNYTGISGEFFTGLPEYCVNTRICRMEEVSKWMEEGGIMVGIERPGLLPQTPWEEHIVSEQLKVGAVKLIINNDSNADALHRLMVDLFLWEEGKNGREKIQSDGDRPWHVRVSGGLGTLRQLPYTPDGL